MRKVTKKQVRKTIEMMYMHELVEGCSVRMKCGSNRQSLWKGCFCPGCRNSSYQIKKLIVKESDPFGTLKQRSWLNQLGDGCRDTILHPQGKARLVAKYSKKLGDTVGQVLQRK